jgi:hypothetical protein
MHRDFFEIAIYRVTSDRLHKEYEAAKAKMVRGVNANYGGKTPPDTLLLLEDSFWRRYGMPWRYNQAIGWLRLHAFGHQVRGELWLHEAKRYQRVGHKHYIHQGKAFECYVYPEDSNPAILKRVREDLLTFQRGFHRGRFTLDLQCFDELAPSIDWHRLLWGTAGHGSA